MQDERDTNRSDLDDASGHYGLGHSYKDSDAASNLRRRSRIPRLRAGEMHENLNPAVDAKGRPIAVLPEPGIDCDPKLYEKTADEIVKILEARVDSDENYNFEREMQEVPGGRQPGHSSSGGRKPQKPRPHPDNTKQNVVDVEDLSGPPRPHAVSGKVSTLGKHGLYAASELSGVSLGEMFDVLGETLHVGVPWPLIELTLRKMREEQMGA